MENGECGETVEFAECASLAACASQRQTNPPANLAAGFSAPKREFFGAEGAEGDERTQFRRARPGNRANEATILRGMSAVRAGWLLREVKMPGVGAIVRADRYNPPCWPFGSILEDGSGRPGISTVMIGRDTLIPRGWSRGESGERRPFRVRLRRLRDWLRRRRDRDGRILSRFMARDIRRDVLVVASARIEAGLLTIHLIRRGSARGLLVFGNGRLVACANS